MHCLVGWVYLPFPLSMSQIFLYPPPTTHTYTHTQMIPIESFECQSMTGNFVPIVPGGSNIKLTYQNRKEYVEKALNFRLHELDHQVHT